MIRHASLLLLPLALLTAPSGECHAKLFVLGKVLGSREAENTPAQPRSDDAAAWVFSNAGDALSLISARVDPQLHAPGAVAGERTVAPPYLTVKVAAEAGCRIELTGVDLFLPGGARFEGPVLVEAVDASGVFWAAVFGGESLGQLAAGEVLGPMASACPALSGPIDLRFTPAWPSSDTSGAAWSGETTPAAALTLDFARVEVDGRVVSPRVYKVPEPTVLAPWTALLCLALVWAAYSQMVRAHELSLVELCWPVRRFCRDRHWTCEQREAITQIFSSGKSD